MRKSQKTLVVGQTTRGNSRVATMLVALFMAISAIFPSLVTTGCSDGRPTTTVGTTSTTTPNPSDGVACVDADSDGYPDVACDLATFEGELAADYDGTPDCKSGAETLPECPVDWTLIDCSDEIFSRCNRCVNPGALETCDGVDNDCDEAEDEQEPCDDGNSCTTDTCNGAMGCSNVPLEDESPCTDDDACTEVDSCQAGVCVPGGEVDCDDSNPCTMDSCDVMAGCVNDGPANNGLVCDDGAFCTIADTCSAGECVGVQNNCADTLFCTADSCDEEANVCVHEAIVCDIGQKCTEGQVAPVCGAVPCNPVNDQGPNGEFGGNCWEAWFTPAEGVNLPEGYGFYCAEGTSVCTPYWDTDHSEWPDSEGPCDDGIDGDLDGLVDCTDPACSGMPGCQPCQVAGDCGSDPCVTYSCVGGFCSQDLEVNDGDACDDGDSCTAVDTCASGMCVGTGAVVCDDLNVCSADSCNPQAGCQFSLIGACPGVAGQMAVITVAGRTMAFNVAPNTSVSTGGFDVLPPGTTSVTIFGTTPSEPCDCFNNGAWLGECGVQSPTVRFCPPAP